MEALEGQALADGIGLELRFHCVELRFGPAWNQRSTVDGRKRERYFDARSLVGHRSVTPARLATSTASERKS